MSQSTNLEFEGEEGARAFVRGIMYDEIDVPAVRSLRLTVNQDDWSARQDDYFAIALGAFTGGYHRLQVLTVTVRGDALFTKENYVLAAPDFSKSTNLRESRDMAAVPTKFKAARQAYAGATTRDALEEFPPELLVTEKQTVGAVLRLRDIPEVRIVGPMEEELRREIVATCGTAAGRVRFTVLFTLHSLTIIGRHRRRQFLGRRRHRRLRRGSLAAGSDTGGGGPRRQGARAGRRPRQGRGDHRPRQQGRRRRAGARGPPARPAPLRPRPPPGHARPDGPRVQARGPGPLHRPRRAHAARALPARPVAADGDLRRGLPARLAAGPRPPRAGRLRRRQAGRVCWRGARAADAPAARVQGRRGGGGAAGVGGGEEEPGGEGGAGADAAPARHVRGGGGRDGVAGRAGRGVIEGRGALGRGREGK